MDRANEDPRWLLVLGGCRRMGIEQVAERRNGSRSRRNECRIGVGIAGRHMWKAFE